MHLDELFKNVTYVRNFHPYLLTRADKDRSKNHQSREEGWCGQYHQTSAESRRSSSHYEPMRLRSGERSRVITVYSLSSDLSLSVHLHRRCGAGSSAASSGSSSALCASVPLETDPRYRRLVRSSPWTRTRQSLVRPGSGGAGTAPPLPPFCWVSTAELDTSTYQNKSQEPGYVASKSRTEIPDFIVSFMLCD